MDSRHDKVMGAVLEQLIAHGPEGIAAVFARTLEIAMQVEHERFLGAGHYERTPDRRATPTATNQSGSTRQCAW